MRKLTPALATFLLAAAPALAASDVVRGGRIAQKCAGCHAVGKTGASPNRHAPRFRLLARKYPLDSLQEALAEGIVVGHASPMPQFRLEPAEVDALVAYLKSIQR